MKNLVAIALFLSLFTLNSCQNSDGPPNGGATLDQTEFLKNIGENLIVKGYQNFEGESSDLLESAESFKENPNTTNLEDLRSQWFEAYLSWQKVAFYNFGPAESNAILTINFYPTNVALIESNIGSGNYNLGTAGNTFAKGFPALDYLLFGVADSDENIAEYFSQNENARIYVVDVANDIHSRAEAVFNNWSPDGSNYLNTFVNNKGTSSGSSLSLLVNAWSQYMETHVRNAKIGIPNGNSVATSEKFGPFPDKIEAYYSEAYSRQLLQATNKAILDFYAGKTSEADGVGIYDMLIELNAQNGTLANDYQQLFIDVANQLSALSGTWVESVNNNGDDVTEIFNNYKAIVALLKVDIVSTLSISITYSDNDGD